MGTNKKVYGMYSEGGGYIDKTPAMTSNTAPIPNVTSASTISEPITAAWKAFDHVIVGKRLDITRFK